MALRNKLTDVLRTIFPSTKFEFVLLAIFLIGYGILGSTIALNYRIIFDDRIPWDAYFSYDNRAIVMTGGGYERHPLANYYFEWLREFAYLFSDGKKNDTFRLVLAWCSNLAISLSLIQLYKYLKNIIKLPQKISLLILGLFAFFSTNILLSFTPETYTYTLLFLVLFNYYAALQLQKEKKISAPSLVFAGLAVGGLTITNIVKVYLPVLFEKGLFRNSKKFANGLFRVILSVGVFLLLFLYRVDFKLLSFLNKSGEQLEKFSKPKVIPVWDMIVSWFWGGNMLFSGFELRDYHNKKGFEYKALFMEVYDVWSAYIFVAIIAILIFWSYIVNFRNKLVQIIMLSFLVDVIIHCVLKFGLHTSYIYGGHYIFVVPLLIGWLFYAYRDSPKILTGLYFTVGLCFVYLATNNIFRMSEFFTFLNLYYQ